MIQLEVQINLSKWVLLALALGFLYTPAVVAQANARPNSVIILVDDMGWSDIGCYGSEIPTPNLDALAAKGVPFTQFYNTARCSPTRASLLTGLYPHRAGMGHLDNIIREGSLGTTGRLNEHCVTMAEVLREAGYFTAMAGKWHLGQQNGTPPWQRGFDRVLNLRGGSLCRSIWMDGSYTASQPTALNETTWLQSIPTLSENSRRNGRRGPNAPM